MKRLINNLNFLLFVKPIKLNAGGKAFMPPCELKFPVSVDLIIYTEQFRQEEENLFEVTESVKDLLDKFNKTFDAPLGWMIVAKREANPKLREDALIFQSKEFCYSPATNQTLICRFSTIGSMRKIFRIEFSAKTSKFKSPKVKTINKKGEQLLYATTEKI